MRRFGHLALVLAACGGPLDPPLVPAAPATPAPVPLPPPAPLTAVEAIAAPAVDCSAGAWCWRRNRPLTLIGDRDHGTVLAFGAEGTFLLWQDDRWASIPVPTGRTITSAWAAGPRDAWAIDEDGSAWHLDGAAWVEAPADSALSRVFAAPDGTVWAKAAGLGNARCGSIANRLLRRDGARWVEAVAPHPYCIDSGDYLVRAGGELWSAGMVCGDSPSVEVRRWDGAAWTLIGAAIPDQPAYPILQVVGGRVRVQAAGTYEWDGAAWTALAPRPLPPQDLPSDQRAFWDGLGYTVVSSAVGCTSGVRLDATRAWCMGSAGILAETAAGWAPTLVDDFADTRPAAEWGTLPPELWAGSDTVRAWGSDPSWVYRVRRSTGSKLERYDGATWRVELDAAVRDLDGTADGVVWAVTDSGVKRLTNGRCAAWVDEPLPTVFGELGEVRAVRAFDARTAFVMTARLLLRFDGTGWSVHAEAPEGWSLGALAGTGADDLWLLRRQDDRAGATVIAHSVGFDWRDVAVPDADEVRSLRSSGGATWAAGTRQVVRLQSRSSEAPIGLPRGGFGGGSVWDTGSALWLSNEHQAMAFERP